MKPLLTRILPAFFAMSFSAYTSNALADSLTTTNSDLDWCPSKGSPSIHPSGRLRIATWNIATLHAENGKSIFPNSAKRSDIDYQRIRCYIRLIDADILAVQEIQNKKALERVIDTDVYDIHISSRSANQRTGFAFKKGLNITKKPDFSALDVGSVRHGSRIDLIHNGKKIRLMSVHLKSGCFSNQHDGTNSDCAKLQKQVPILENWIDEATKKADGFIILGDFNRRLNQPGDRLWEEWDDDNSPINTITLNMPISCRDNKFTDFIDHIVIDDRTEKWIDHTSSRHQTFRQADKSKWNLISDHCPVITELWIK